VDGQQKEKIMEKEKLESLLIDYIDHKLNSAEKFTVQQELANNPVACKLYEELREIMDVMDKTTRLEPSSSLKAGFEESLKNEITASAKKKTIIFQPSFYRVAAAIALMILSGAVGFWISKNNDQQKRLALIEKEMEATRKQLEGTKQMMLAMLDNDQSASQRIQGVHVAMKIEQADDEVVEALLKTMNEDPNTNVRLAALHALSKFRQEPQIRKALIHALSTQKDPMVQINLIQLMVQMKEKEVVKDLQKIVDDKGTLNAVKDEAYSGILKLS
jgi:predicted Zn-ribbon and HTH transcriptional regulator